MRVIPFEYERVSQRPVVYQVRVYLLIVQDDRGNHISCHPFFHQSEMLDNGIFAREAGFYTTSHIFNLYVSSGCFDSVFRDILEFEKNVPQAQID